MCSLWTCSHLWKLQGESGGTVNSAIQLEIQLCCAAQWAQGLLESNGPQVTLMKIFFLIVSSWHSHQWPAGGYFVGLWQCSSCSSLLKWANSGPADRLRTFYRPIHLLENNGLSPGISSTILRLHRERQQTWKWHMLMYHPGGSGLPVQSVQSRYCLKLQVVTLTLDKCKTIENQKRMEKMSVASTCKTIIVWRVASLLPI